MKMRWMDVQSVDELKSLGSFKEVMAEIKSAVGSHIKLTGRSFDELFESIVAFRETVLSLNIKPLHEEEPSNAYFSSPSSESIYYLVELTGDVQTEKLGIGKTHYSNKRVAKKWKDSLTEVLSHEVDHPKVDQARRVLDELYEAMLVRPVKK